MGGYKDTAECTVIYSQIIIDGRNIQQSWHFTTHHLITGLGTRSISLMRQYFSAPPPKPTIKNKYMWAKMCRLKNQTICINWYSDMYIISGNLFFFKCTRLRLLDGQYISEDMLNVCSYYTRKMSVNHASINCHFSSSPKALK